MSGKRTMPAEDDAWLLKSTYAWTDALPGSGWAWEYARRNPEFHKSWHDGIEGFVPQSHRATAHWITRGVTRSSLDAWGCLYADDWRLDARTASVVWAPSVFRAAVSMIAVAADTPLNAGVVDLLGTEVRTVVLHMPDGIQHVLYRDGVESLHLVVNGADVSSPVHLLTDMDMSPEQARYHAHALKSLSEMRASGRLQQSLCRKPPRPARLQHVLQALDGSLAGAPPREIAVALFGAARVDRDWDVPGHNLRDQVRRAVKRGQALMKGGYRSFLK